jgi:hypothetical protein
MPRPARAWEVLWPYTLSADWWAPIRPYDEIFGNGTSEVSPAIIDQKTSIGELIPCLSYLPTSSA